jgi:hypothetical protein
MSHLGDHGGPGGVESFMSDYRNQAAQQEPWSALPPSSKGTHNQPDDEVGDQSILIGRARRLVLHFCSLRLQFVWQT